MVKSNYDPALEAACQKALWEYVAKHPQLPSVLFQEGYWESGKDVFMHLDSVKDFHGGTSQLPSWDVLDLGCGVGRQTLHLAREAKKTTGADVSKSLIRLARRFKNLKKSRATRYKVVNGKNLKNLGTACYDLIYSSSMFASFRYERHIIAYIKEIHKLLKPGGFAQLDIPTTETTFSEAFHPESWGRLIEGLQFAQADVILDDIEWFLFQK